MANMNYQCIYCKAQYAHADSYKHNAYQCPKQPKTRIAMTVLVLVTMLWSTGCEAIQNLLPKDEFPAAADRTELILYRGTEVFKFNCTLDVQAKALTDCQEVK